MMDNTNISSKLFDKMDDLEKIKGILAYNFTSNEYLLRGIISDGIELNNSEVSGHSDNNQMIIGMIESLYDGLSEIHQTLRDTKEQ